MKNFIWLVSFQQVVFQSNVFGELRFGKIKHNAFDDCDRPKMNIIKIDKS